MEAKIISGIENRIGYKFKDKRLLIRAFTHSSASRIATQNYESLEFLGDSVLSLVVSKRLMAENPDAHEGALTQRRAEIVSQDPLQRAIDKLGVAQFLIVGRGERLDQILHHTKVKSNLFEAIVGAIYIDSAGLQKCEEFVYFALKDHFDGGVKHIAEMDYKTQLNEFAFKHKLKVEYVTVSESGPSHEPVFTVDVLIDGIASGRGKGSSKKAAQQVAASVALGHINSV